MALLLADSFRPLNDNWSPFEVSILYEDFGRQIGGSGLCGTWSCRVSKLLKPLQSEMIQCVLPFTLSTMTQSMPNSYSTPPNSNYRQQKGTEKAAMFLVLYFLFPQVPIYTLFIAWI